MAGPSAGRRGRHRGADHSRLRRAASRRSRSSSACPTAHRARPPRSTGAPRTSSSTRAGLRVLLRPSSGSDLELFPHLAGLGALLEAGVTAVLPVVAEPARGDDRRRGADARSRASSAPRGAGSCWPPAPRRSSTATRSSRWPPTRRPTCARTSTTCSPRPSPGSIRSCSACSACAPANHVAVLSGAGVLTVTVRTVVLEVHRAPLAVSVQGSVDGLPVIGAVSAGAGRRRRRACRAGRPRWVRPRSTSAARSCGRSRAARSARRPGWQAEIGLGLDDTAPTDVGHRELLARWRQADGLALVATDRTGPTTVDEDTSAEGVATAAIGAVLDLVGGWVLGVDDVKTQLEQRRSGPRRSRFVLEGSVLEPGPVEPAAAAARSAHGLAGQAAHDGRRSSRRRRLPSTSARSASGSPRPATSSAST